MIRHTIANLFVSAGVAFAALMIIVGVVGARASTPPHTESPAINSASHRATTSTLALPQVITTLYPFEGITPSPLPIRIGIDPRSGYVYIVCEQNNVVLVLRGTQVIGMIDRGTDWMNPVSEKHGIAVNPINGYTYIGNVFRKEISVLSYTQFVTNIRAPSFVGSFGDSFEANPVNGYVYAPVTGLSWYSIMVLSDTQAVAEIRTAPFDSPRTGVIINANTGIVYAVNRTNCRPCPPDDFGSLITPISGTQALTSTSMPGEPYGAGINLTTGYIYIVGLESASFKEAPNAIIYTHYTDTIRVLSGTQVIPVPGSMVTVGLGINNTGPMPPNVQVNPTTGYVYAARPNLLTILTGTEVITNLMLQIRSIAINPTSGYVYLRNAVTNTITVMSGTEIIGTLPVASGSDDIQVNPQTGLIYITNYADQSITILRDMVDPESSPSGLLLPDEEVIIDFGEPMITSTIGVEISPALPHTLTWSAESDRAVIAHEPFEPGTRYTLHVQPGGQAASGLPVIEREFNYMYLPFHLFVPLFER